MVLLGEAGGAREYLESTDLLPTLEAGIEAMLKACMEEGRKDPVNYLATYLMRNNPRTNPEAKAMIEALRSKTMERDAQLAKEAAMREENSIALMLGQDVEGLLVSMPLEIPGGGQMILEVKDE